MAPSDRQDKSQSLLPEDFAWHAASPAETLLHLGSSRNGLSEGEALHRLERYGPNRLPEPSRPTPFAIVFRQLNNPLVLVLVAAMVVSLLLGHRLDAGFIAAVILINMVIGAVQEWRAEESAAALDRTIHAAATVLRDGQRRVVDVGQVVPGDIVLLEPGAVVPADMRLLSAAALRVDESLLTGESVPVTKDAGTHLAADTPLAERTVMAHAGTMVVSGRASGLVTATGSQTQIGAISHMLSGSGGKAPLLIRMERFSNRIALATVLIALAIGFGQYWRGVPFADVFLLTVALAVSAIPEGLPMAITVALSIAASRMGRRNVIVRHLPAVEALGSCTLIATDKTGTLTVNRLTARRVVLPDGTRFDIGGEGLESDGEITAGDGSKAADVSRLHDLARAGILANEADIAIEGDRAAIRGDAVDGAFLILAHKIGIGAEAVRGCHTHHDALAYEPERGFAASLDRFDGNGFLSVKGAPERVLTMCRPDQAENLRPLAETLAAEGYRVIALAGRAMTDEAHAVAEGDLCDLDLLGFVGLVDPLKSEAPAAVREARAAGVDIRMITGDHPETACTIARELDPSWPLCNVLTGRDIAAMNEAEREAAILAAPIYARVEPAQKNLIVRALQKAGHFVAVTGDGVNDAPALKTAHVGIAMGNGGTDVARAASDLILKDDNFASIVAGIEEGRAAYDNIRKIVWLLISTAIAEVLLFSLALAFNLPMPLTALQILWLNLVTEGIQDAALAFEAREPRIMQRRPRAPGEAVFDRQMIEQCLMIGLYVGTASFVLFWWLHAVQGMDVTGAGNLVLLFMVCFNNFQALNCRSETRSIFTVPLRSNPFLVLGVAGAQGLHIIAMYVPVLSDILDLRPVAPAQWALILALAASVLLLGEVYKLAVARPRARRARLDPGQLSPRETALSSTGK